MSRKSHGDIGFQFFKFYFIFYSDIPVERQARWFKDSFDHLLAIAQSDQAPDAGVMLTSGYTDTGLVIHVARKWSHN